MTGIKFVFNDLNLDEAGLHHELVLEHHDGTTSFILTDEELADLWKAARERLSHRRRAFE